MAIYGVTEAKAKLSQLLERALRGEAVVIAKNGKPLVRMEPLPQRSIAARRGLIKRTVKKYRKTLRKLADH